MLKKYMFFILVAFFSHAVYANETTGLLKKIFINKDGLVLFKLSNSISPRVKCASNIDWDFKFSLKNNYSTEMLDLLKFSKANEIPVIIGFGAEAKCGSGFPAVNIEYLYLNNMLVIKHNKGNYTTGK